MQRTLTYTSFSLPGHRKDNQDRYEIFHSGNRTELLAIVADGLGGHKDGGMAAAAVIQAARDLWAARARNGDMREFLLGLVNRAHATVIEAGKSYDSAPRSTLAALYVRDDLAVSVHLGDSRIIQYSAEGFVQRTMDHSVAHLKVLRGVITEAEVATDPDQNKLFNCVGGDVPPEPEFVVWTLLPLSRFVLCTDGYWSLFAEGELIRELNHSESAEEVIRSANALIQRRKQHDDTTAIFIHMDTPAKEKGAVKFYVKPISTIILVVAILIAIASTLRNPAQAPAQSEPVQGKTVDMFEVGSDEEGREGTIEMTSSNPLRATENRSATETGYLAGETGSGDNQMPAPSMDQPSERGVELPEVISTRRQKVNIPVTGSAEVVDQKDVSGKAEAYLKEAGVLGQADSLIATRQEKIVGTAKVLKLQQFHRGLPVYGAEVVVVVDGDMITEIESKSVADITLNIEPQLSYAKALGEATVRTGEVMEAQDDGRLIIYSVRQSYRLAWQGLVAGNTLETVIIDAGNSNILYRYSAVYKENQYDEQ